MSERKVLNKYYPPDFDPSKIPRMKLARNRQYTVRLMAPFNMRCKTCGEYIYKGKKFNARKEDVEGDDYLGIRIYRFYIKCTRCLQEISFKTDPKNTDYEIEAGATRNFMALKLAEEQAQREEDEEKEEEATNPMKLLEKRTQQSKQELELLESLEELKDLNRRQQTIDYDQMLEQFDTEAARQRTVKEQEEADEEYIKSVFKKKNKNTVIVEEEIVELDERQKQEPPKKIVKTSQSTKEAKRVPKEVQDESSPPTKVPEPPPKLQANPPKPPRETVVSLGSKRTLMGLVKRKANIGVKLSSSSEPASEKRTKSPDESTEAATKPANGDKSSNPVQEAGNSKDTTKSVHSSLSLLGAYSGSSDNDSD